MDFEASGSRRHADAAVTASRLREPQAGEYLKRVCSIRLGAKFWGVIGIAKSPSSHNPFFHQGYVSTKTQRKAGLASGLCAIVPRK
jgi:hypothetical protein